MSDERKQIILTERDIDFMSHFCLQYNENLRKGKTQNSYHDAVAVLIALQDILGIDPGAPAGER